MSNGATVLRDAAEARAALPRILSRHHVPGDRSPDLAEAQKKSQRGKRKLVA